MQKFFLVIVLFLLAPPVLAASDSEALRQHWEAEATCGNFVRWDAHNLYTGFGSYRRGIEEPRVPTLGRFTVIPGSGNPSFSLATHDAAIDVVTVAGRAFVLTYSGLEEFDLASHEWIATYRVDPVPGPLAYKQHAESMARYGDKLIIAHGRLGAVIFDVPTRTLSRRIELVVGQRPLESMATGVTVQGPYAYVVMDNFSLVAAGQPQAFRGIVKIDMRSEKVVSESSGLDPGADAVTAFGDQLIVSYGGSALWKFVLHDIGGTTLPQPLDRVWHYPIKGHPTGRPSADDTYYFTCFIKAPAQPGGVYTRVPVALSH